MVLLSIRLIKSFKERKSIDKKVAYTNKEKYELLKKKNPIIEDLRNQFKLSI